MCDGNFSKTWVDAENFIKDEPVILVAMYCDISQKAFQQAAIVALTILDSPFLVT